MRPTIYAVHRQSFTIQKIDRSDLYKPGNQWIPMRREDVRKVRGGEWSIAVKDGKPAIYETKDGNPVAAPAPKKGRKKGGVA